MLSTRNSFVSRTRAVTLALAGCAAAVLVGGWHRLDLSREIPVGEIHRDASRVAILEELSRAIVPAGEAAQDVRVCPELANVKRAVDRRLSSLAERRRGTAALLKQRYVLDVARLPQLDDCKAKAVAIDREVKRSWMLFRVADAWRENAMNKSERQWRGRQWRPHISDIETRDAWATIPGCVRDAEGAGVSGVCKGEEPREMVRLLRDPQLTTDIAMRLSASENVRSGREIEFRGKSVPVGNDVSIGFDRRMQKHANALVRCYTGYTSYCDVLPDRMRGLWYFAPGNIRAGAAAVVLVDIESGLVLAAASSISHCTLENLARDAETVRVRGRVRIPMFRPSRPDELCAQLPDRTGALGWLTQQPIFWLVGPGSTMKIIAMLAGIESGVLPPKKDKQYRLMLAQSHDNLTPQRIARASSAKFVELLQTFGFTGEKRSDVLFGLAHEQGWPVFTRAGFVVEPFAINEALFRKIYAAKRAGRNADALFGHEQVAEYLKAYREGIAAIGSGSIRTSAWGLADMARRLALRAQGATSMVATRMADLENTTAEQVPLDFARPESVRRLFHMLDAATASRLGGTAAGSCRRVFGHCNPDGQESIVFSKTGTAEATTGGEAGVYVKEGGSGTPPAKLYVQVFRGADGRLYAGGAMTLRIRSRPRSARPELRSNSAAELLMLASAGLMGRDK